MEKTSPTAKASDPVPRITPMAVVKPTTCSNARFHQGCGQRHEGVWTSSVYISTALPCLHRHASAISGCHHACSLLACMSCMCQHTQREGLAMALPYKFSGRSCIKWVMVVLLLEAISHVERLVVGRC